MAELGGPGLPSPDLLLEIEQRSLAVQTAEVAGQRAAGGQEEFVLLEQRPRAQSRAHVLRPPRGAFVIFPTRERPNKGSNGYHRVGMRHGVATVTRGERTAMGVIFHDAK